MSLSVSFSTEVLLQKSFLLSISDDGNLQEFFTLLPNYLSLDFYRTLTMIMSFLKMNSDAEVFGE
jgi:hypothetical protein